MIKLGNVVDVLRRKYDDDTFSGCFCDPPYGLNFMGKTWDGEVPDVDVWSEVYRTMKSGSYVLAFGGTRTWHRLAVAIEDAGFEIRDTIMWVYGTGFPKGQDIGKSTKCSNWEGYGTVLKPAYEPIIMAMKPLDGTYANNALEHGIAGINIDVSRVGDEIMKNDGIWDTNTNPYPSHKFAKRSDYTPSQMDKREKVVGRYPANLIHDGSDEVAKNFPKTTSRFFYVPKPSQKERNEGLDDLPDRNAGIYAQDEWSRKNMGNTPDSQRSPIKNIHPTVKPIKLCEYIAKMILPPNPTEQKLLVPFSGSGSEIIGAMNAGWEDVTGIEISEEFIEIAKRRIEYHHGPKGVEKFFGG
tara:strand:- start:2105 stop:3166 length:1062 start_codon:yes stop_codon:yes gene_type:complete